LARKPDGERSHGRSEYGWEDIKMNLKRNTMGRQWTRCIWLRTGAMTS